MACTDDPNSEAFENHDFRVEITHQEKKTKQKRTPPHAPSNVNHLLRASSRVIDNC